jgi:4-hydroxymandelate oxidase
MSARPINLADYEAMAHTGADPSIWAYLQGAAADGLTHQGNRRAWDHIALQPRVLRSLRHGSTHATLLGHPMAWPALVAPMAYQRLAHPSGEAGMALAAAMQGAGMIISNQTSMPLPAVMAPVLHEPGRGPLWFQLYPQSDKNTLQAMATLAQAQGCEALVLTADAAVNGVRDQERRAAFQLPDSVQAMHWQPTAATQALSGLCQGAAHAAFTWDDLAWLQSITSLPILLKGVLHPHDAVTAARMGIDGLIVSNHGGRTLDTAVPTAQALPRVAQALAQLAQSSGRTPVGRATGQPAALLVDGGIRRGTDVLKALALGADAVLVGRPCLHGLMHSGPQGAAHVLRLLRDEFEAAMALCGCAQLADIRSNDLVLNVFNKIPTNNV